MPRPLPAWRTVRGVVHRHVARRPLTAFSLLVFGVGWPLLAVLAHAARARGLAKGVLLGQPAEHWLGLAITALVLLPAALLVTGVRAGIPGIGALLRRATQWRIGVGWTLVITLALPVLAFALALAAGAGVRQGADARIVIDYVESLVTRTAVINLWEELAWAGFFQMRLQQRHGVVWAALATAVPFAAIHVPLFFLDGRPALAGFAALVVLGAVFRLLVGVVLAGTGGSVLAAGVTHAAFNSTNNREGVLHAALGGVDLSWQALAATALLVALLGVHLATRRPPSLHTRTARARGR